MTRAAFVLLHLAIAIVIALVLLGLWQLLLTGAAGEAFGEGARLLFFFMDVGLALWAVLLIVASVRGWGRSMVILSALIGAVLNLLTVVVVGAIQSGWAPLFIVFALEAGTAFLVGALVAAIVVPRIVKPGRAASRPV